MGISHSQAPTDKLLANPFFRRKTALASAPHFAIHLCSSKSAHGRVLPLCLSTLRICGPGIKMIWHEGYILASLLVTSLSLSRLFLCLSSLF